MLSSQKQMRPPSPSKNSQVDYVSLLPREILAEILRYIEPKEQHKLLRVCKNMRQVMLQDILGNTYLASRDFLYFQRNELKHLSLQIQKFSDKSKKSLFDTLRLDYALTIQHHLLNFSGIVLLLHAIRIANPDLSGFKSSIDQHTLAGACLLFGLGVLVTNYIYTRKKALTSPIIESDCELISQSPLLESLLRDAQIQVGITTLAQYETLLLTALELANKHLSTLEQRFTITPPTGKHSLTITTLNQFLMKDPQVARYATCTFNLWTKSKKLTPASTTDITPRMTH